MCLSTYLQRNSANSDLRSTINDRAHTKIFIKSNIYCETIIIIMKIIKKKGMKISSMACERPLLSLI